MKRYGLIGYPLSHSFSQKYFAEKFLKESIVDAVYENYSIPDIKLLSGILETQTDLRGFNVTIPYKKAICSFLTSFSPVVEAIGACNCVNIKNEELIGHNTDVIGFEKSLEPFLKAHHNQALILGTGGAAAAVAYVFKKRGIYFKYVSRQASDSAIAYEALNEEMMNQYKLIINTTPLGMSPNIDECPPLPFAYINASHHCFDLIYNPSETLFLQKAKASGASIQNGAEMLVLQAEESWRIWNEG